MCANVKTEIDKSGQANDFNDRLLSTDARSYANSDKPSLPRLATGTPKLKQTELLKKMAKPKCKESKTETAEPNHA